MCRLVRRMFFFFNDTATTEIYTLSLHDALPIFVILCHGGNDFLRKLDEAQAANNIRAMVRLARSQGAQVVLIGVPKLGLLPSPAGFYADIAKELRLPYEETALKKILTDNGLKSDLVHPNAAGYARLAEAIAAPLKKSGAVGRRTDRRGMCL